jgi:hypothetical protein
MSHITREGIIIQVVFLKVTKLAQPHAISKAYSEWVCPQPSRKEDNTAALNTYQSTLHSFS